VRVRRAAAELARRFAEKPKQLNTFESVDDLIAEAEASNDALHAAMRHLVESVGGTYDRGPLKRRERIEEKMYADYNGDPRRVVDICRASCVFLTMTQLALALETLLAEAGLIVVRAKDRLNNPTSFGYRDMLLNIRLNGGQHVAELQLHLAQIHAIKPLCHRTYAILRQFGWEDLELVSDGEESGSESEDEKWRPSQQVVLPSSDRGSTLGGTNPLHALARPNTGPVVTKAKVIAGGDCGKVPTDFDLGGHVDVQVRQRQNFPSFMPRCHNRYSNVIPSLPTSPRPTR